MSRGARRCSVIPAKILPVLLLQAVISVHTELVAVPVAVTDARGRHVSGLGQQSFQLFDDGRPQPIAVFLHGDAPVTLGLVVDRSQSMRPKSSALVSAVSALLQSSRPDDELFGVGFNDRVSFAPSIDRPFISDAKELEVALTAVRAEGKTALYDGVAEGLQHLQLSHTQKHALIVVSDGGDNASRRTYAQVLDLARRSDAVIYAIGLLGTPPAEEEEDAGLLERLCRDTGGVAYFPHAPAEISADATSISTDIRNQYMLGFAPATRDGGRAFRKIEVKVISPGTGRLHVRSRVGYLAPRTQPQQDRRVP
jgi:Ca-activated chloride channel family protein